MAFHWTEHTALTAIQMGCATWHHGATDRCEDLVDFCCEVHIWNFSCSGDSAKICISGHV